LPPYQMEVSGTVQLIDGAFLSTLLSAIGPAMTVCPTASLTEWLPVEAFESSVLAGTLVERLKFASPETASPEPPSEALQRIETSAWCHAPSAEPQLTLGFFLSTLLPPSGPAVVVWPTPSVRVFEPVRASSVSVPFGTVVESEKLESLE